MNWLWRDEHLPGDPWQNMAADAALLSAAQEDPTTLPIVRIYRWDRPAVSIGRWQGEEEARALFPGLPLARRPTGGLAVLHGKDITISVAARLSCLPQPRGGVMASYRQIIGGLMTAYAAMGITATVGREGCAKNYSGDCFATTARCDLVDSRTGRKLLGSAQRRERGAILQQMSLPTAYIPNEERFLGAVQAGMAVSFAVDNWIVVDIGTSTCYTQTSVD